MHFDVLIVGAGHGGAQAAIALRQLNFGGSIAIVGAEPELPYERPPLSKDYLAGEKPFERLLIRPPGFWDERRVTMLLGRRAAAVNAAAHAVTLDDGARLRYGKLIWASGGEPRRLSCDGAGLAGVHAIRSRADVDRMKAELAGAGRIVVIGGGYIGLEAAAVLRKLGKQIVLLEALDRVLARVAGDPVSRFYEARHRAHGVDLRTGVAVERIVGDGASATAVQLHGGEIVAADLVVAGIGIVPAVGPLADAGAICGDGVHVDEHCRTSVPDIYAIGDCAAQVNRFAAGARIRVESVQNASDQAICAAKAIAGLAEPYAAVPWFWSNQYDLKLQTVGLSSGYDEVVVRGEPASGSFSTLYLRRGQIVALDCVNRVKDYVQGRALVVAGATPDRAALADVSRPLKELGGSGRGPGA